MPDGYACVRVDSRGAGRSPGFMDLYSAREKQDLYHCIGWAAAQPWSSGKVGLNGISYYGMNQWQVAALQPPHLAAMCVWEGAADFYRDFIYHGGILCAFGKPWFPGQVIKVQHGRGSRGYRSRMTGGWVSGPPTLTEEELGANRSDFYEDCLNNPLATDEYWRSRTPDLSKITVPLLSAANWGGQGLHPRGNFEGFMRAGAEQKWLEVHGIEHWTHFYTDYGVGLQKKFFGHFLKGEDTGWQRQPKVLLQVRHPGERFVERRENEWPLARAEWTRLYLDPADTALIDKPPALDGSVTYSGLGEGVTFLTPPLETETEITGPIAAKLHILVRGQRRRPLPRGAGVRPNGKEVIFQGALDPHTPIAQGWLGPRTASSTASSAPYRPYHTHDENRSSPDRCTSWISRSGRPASWCRRAVASGSPSGEGLRVRGRGGTAATFVKEMKGCGPFVHDDPQDRPPEIYGGKVTLYGGGDKAAYVLLPIIPKRDTTQV